MLLGHMCPAFSDPQKTASRSELDPAAPPSEQFDACSFRGSARVKGTLLLIGAQLLSLGCARDPGSVDPAKFTTAAAGERAVPTAWEADVLVTRFLSRGEDEGLPAGRALQYSPKVAVQALIKELEKDPHDIMPIVFLLGGFGAQSAPAESALIAELSDTTKRASPSHPEMAAAALAMIGKPAVPALIKALQDEDGQVRAHAALAIGLMGPEGAEAIPALAARLYEGSGGVYPHPAQQAASALETMGAAAVEPLCRALSSDDDLAALRAHGALRNLGPAAEDAVPVLLKELDRAASAARVADACETLAIVGKNRRDAVASALIACRDRFRADPAGKVPAAAADKALTELAREASPAIPRLVRDYADASIAPYSDYYAGRLIVDGRWLLRKIDPEARLSVMVLTEALTEDQRPSGLPGDQPLKRCVSAAKALARIGSPASSACEQIRGLAARNPHDPDVYLTASAAVALINGTPADCLDELEHALHSDELKTRLAGLNAVQFLAENTSIPLEQVVQPLVDIVARGNIWDRYEALRTLVAIGPRAAAVRPQLLSLKASVGDAGAAHLLHRVVALIDAGNLTTFPR